MSSKPCIEDYAFVLNADSSRRGFEVTSCLHAKVRDGEKIEFHQIPMHRDEFVTFKEDPSRVVEAISSQTK